MPARRELTMRQLRQLLRLARDGVSAREIGRTLGVARSTVQDNLKRADAAGLAWPVGAEITDAVLEQRKRRLAGTFRRGTGTVMLGAVGAPTHVDVRTYACVGAGPSQRRCSRARAGGGAGRRPRRRRSSPRATTLSKRCAALLAVTGSRRSSCSLGAASRATGSRPLGKSGSSFPPWLRRFENLSRHPRWRRRRSALAPAFRRGRDRA